MDQIPIRELRSGEEILDYETFIHNLEYASGFASVLVYGLQKGIKRNNYKSIPLKCQY